MAKGDPALSSAWGMAICTIMITSAVCLRFSLHSSPQLPRSHLQEADVEIEKKLSSLNLQMSAINNTILGNLKHPSVSGGRLALTPAQLSPGYLCVVLNSSQASDLESYISSFEKQLADVRGQVDTRDERGQYGANCDEYSRQTQYIKYLIYNPCQIGIFRGLYAPNGSLVTSSELNQTMRTELLRVRPSNWYVNQYTKNYINSGTEVKMSSPCPQTSPYLIDGQCSLCRDSQVYDYGIGSCGSCSEGHFYNEQSHCCCYVNELSECSGGRIQNANGVCACPSSIPFWTGSACIACFAPSYFDFATRKCLVCQGDQLYNGFQCQTVTCGPYQTFDVHAQKCVCIGTRPYEKAGSCFPCGSSQVFDNVTKTCRPCPQGTAATQNFSTCLCGAPNQFFSFSDFKCKCSTLFPMLNADGSCSSCPAGLFFDQPSQKCVNCDPRTNMILNQGTKTCECPLQLPLFTGSMCFNCGSRSRYYDQPTKTCKQCPASMVVDYQKNTCSCPSSQIYRDKQCRCPEDQPYLANSGCTKCAAPLFFDTSRKECVPCPAGLEFSAALQKCVQIKCRPGTRFDVISQKCICENLSTPYLLTSGECSACPDGQYLLQGACRSCPQNQIYNSTIKQCTCNFETNYFFDGISCVLCEHPRYWNFSSRTCTNCPDKQEYDLVLKHCRFCEQEHPYFNGLHCAPCPPNTYFNESLLDCISCQNGRVFNQSLKQCVCPLDHPFEGSTNCIQCYLPNYYDSATKTCVSCPANQYFDPLRLQCVGCPKQKPFFNGTLCVECKADTFFNASAGVCQTCSGDLVFDRAEKACKCPYETQHFNGSACIYCFLPQYFDLEDKKCKSCPDRQTYNTELKACMFCPASNPYFEGTGCTSCPNNTFYNATNRNCEECSENRFYNAASQQCECLNNTFWNNKTCVQCYHPQYFDFDDLSCKNCPKNFVYDIETKQCERCPHDKPTFDGQRCAECPESSYWNETAVDCIACSGNRTYDKSSKQCVCRQSDLYFDGHACISCIHPRYYDLVKKQCMNCPENLVYDMVMKKCVECPHSSPLLQDNKCTPCPSQTFWNASSRGCVACPGGRTYNQQKSYCECPADRFWNGNSCIECFIPKYFNSELMACVACPRNMLYDLELKKCVKCPSQKPYLDATFCRSCLQAEFWDQIDGQCKKCSANLVFNKASRFCECESHKFFDGWNCIECNFPNYFDNTTKKCLSCGINQIYNLSIKKCVACSQEKPIFDGLECKPCLEGTYYDVEHKECEQCVLDQAGKCQCDVGRAWDGATCVTCSFPRYFDPLSNSCKQCSEGLIWNSTETKCVLA